MLVGYMRVSTNDERQSIDLQRDALIAAGSTSGTCIMIARRARAMTDPA